MAGPVLNSLAETTNVRQVESIQAYDVMSTGNDSSGQVIGLVDHVDPQADAVRRAVDHAADDIYELADVREVDTPYSGSRAPLVSQPHDALLIVATLTKLDRPARNAAIAAIRARLTRLGADLAAAGVPDAQVRVGGDAALNAERGRALDVDRNRAELISLPLTLIVLVVVFGGLVAAGLPVIAAVVSVASAYPGAVPLHQIHRRGRQRVDRRHAARPWPLGRLRAAAGRAVPRGARRRLRTGGGARPGLGDRRADDRVQRADRGGRARRAAHLLDPAAHRARCGRRLDRARGDARRAHASPPRSSASPSAGSSRRGGPGSGSRTTATRPSSASSPGCPAWCSAGR